MSAHSSRLLVFAVRTVRCQSCGAQPLRLAPLARAYSIDSPTLTGGSQKPQAIQKLEKLSNSHSLTHRNLSAVASSLKGQCRPLSRFDFLDVGAVEENIKKALTCRVLRRFIVNPDIASLIADHLDSDLSENRAVIFECNPGMCLLY